MVMSGGIRARDLPGRRCCRRHVDVSQSTVVKMSDAHAIVRDAVMNV